MGPEEEEIRNLHNVGAVNLEGNCFIMVGLAEFMAWQSNGGPSYQSREVCTLFLSMVHYHVQIIGGVG